MKVRMLTSVAGTRDGDKPYVYEAGETYDLPSAEAKDLCARPVDSPRAEPVAVKRADRAERRGR